MHNPPIPGQAHMNQHARKTHTHTRTHTNTQTHTTTHTHKQTHTTTHTHTQTHTHTHPTTHTHTHHNTHTRSLALKARPCAALRMPLTGMLVCIMCVDRGGHHCEHHPFFWYSALPLHTDFSVVVRALYLSFCIV